MASTERVMEITTRIGCRQWCTSCPQDAHVSGWDRLKNEAAHAGITKSFDKMMSVETFKTCIDKLPKNVKIYFAGSVEPYLNPNCTDMVLYAHEQGFTVHLYLTLGGMTKLDMDRVKHIPFEATVVHLKSERKNSNIGSEKDYYEKLKHFVECNFSNVEYMAISDTDKEAERIVGGKVRLVTDEKLSDFAGNLDDQQIGIPVKHYEWKGRIACGRPFWQVLHPNGDVTICCMDFGYQHVIGNLVEGSYESLYQSQEWKKVQASYKSEAIPTICRNCQYVIPIPELKAQPTPPRKRPMAERIAGKLKQLVSGEH